VAIWPSLGEEIVGSDALRAALRQEMATWKSSSFAVTDHQVRLLQADTAFVWGHYDQELEAHPRGARRPVSRRVRGARFFALMVRRPDGWRMLIEGGSIPMTGAMWDTLSDPPPFPKRSRRR